MKKIYIIVAILLIPLILIGASCEKESDTNKKNREEEEENKGGSCNSIELDSSCVDFIGYAWSESYCSGEGKIYSEDPCPQPTVGGCRLNRGESLEKIVWSYDYGGRPLTWQSEVNDVLMPSCIHGPRPGEWMSGTVKLKD